MQNNVNVPEELPLKINLSTGAVTRWLIYVVTAIHILNAFAVWFRYETGPFILKDLFVSIFQVSSEGKFTTWYSACTLFICSILLLLISYAKRRANDRYVFHWLGLALIFALMSLDEATAIHEMVSPHIKSLMNIPRDSAWGWEVAALIFLMVFGLSYFRFVLSLDRRTRFLFLIAGFIFVCGVIGIEMVGGIYQINHGTDLTYGIIASAEEVFEMVGIVIFIFSLLDYLRTYTKTLVFSIEP
jgi:hypothetical protein